MFIDFYYKEGDYKALLIQLQELENITIFTSYRKVVAIQILDKVYANNKTKCFSKTTSRHLNTLRDRYPYFYPMEEEEFKELLKSTIRNTESNSIDSRLLHP